MKRIAEKCAAAADMAAPVFADRIMITISAERVEIEKHHGLVELSDTRISVQGKGVIALITGEKLELGAMTDSMMLILGKITGVELEDI